MQCTCNDVEHLLLLNEGDIIRDERHIVLGFHTRMPCPLQDQPAGALLQYRGPHVGHRGRMGYGRKAHHCIKLCYYVIQRLQWVYIA